MVLNKPSRLILDATYINKTRTARINGTVRILFKTCLIFSHINGPNKNKQINKLNKKILLDTSFEGLSLGLFCILIAARFGSY